jgi:hypothetical protein
MALSANKKTLKPTLAGDSIAYLKTVCDQTFTLYT